MHHKGENPDAISLVGHLAAKLAAEYDETRNSTPSIMMVVHFMLVMLDIIHILLAPNHSVSNVIVLSCCGNAPSARIRGMKSCVGHR